MASESLSLSLAEAGAHVGDPVVVECRSVGEQVLGHVSEILPGGKVMVQFVAANQLCRKATSTDNIALLAEVDPKTAAVSQGYAASALAKVLITTKGMSVKATDVGELGFQFQPFRNSTFISSLPIKGDLYIQYAGQGEDTVLKFHILNADKYDKSDANRYEEVGFLHALLPLADQKLTLPPCAKDTPHFLGLTLHHGLSNDLHQKMQENCEARDYWQCLVSRLMGDFKIRGEPLAETLACESHFLVSYCSKDSAVNNELLQRLATDGIDGPHTTGGDKRVKFCTDRSLGFGTHFFEQKKSGEEMLTLHLGKHGFAQPIAAGGWWDEFKNAAAETKYGLLVLNPTSNYFRSKACVKEWTGFPKDRVWTLSSDRQRITLHKSGGRAKFRQTEVYDLCKKSMENQEALAEVKDIEANMRGKGLRDAFRTAIHTIKDEAKKQNDEEALKCLLFLAQQGSPAAMEDLKKCRRFCETRCQSSQSNVAEMALGVMSQQ